LKNTLSSKERLKSKKAIEQLFKRGSRLKGFPVGLSYFISAVEAKEAGVVIMVSVPKKKVKKAVHRNKIKRQLREAYRTQKQAIVTTAKRLNVCIHVAFVYQGDHSSNFTELSEKIKQHLSRLITETEKHYENNIL